METRYLKNKKIVFMMSKHPKQTKNRLRVSWLFSHPQYKPQALIFFALHSSSAGIYRKY